MCSKTSSANGSSLHQRSSRRSRRSCVVPCLSVAIRPTLRWLRFLRTRPHANKLTSPPAKFTQASVCSFAYEPIHPNNKSKVPISFINSEANVCQNLCLNEIQMTSNNVLHPLTAIDHSSRKHTKHGKKRKKLRLFEFEKNLENVEIIT